MMWHPFINVEIKRDFIDNLSLIINLILGITAIFSLWISSKVFKKSEFDSAMSTSPSIIIRTSPDKIWFGIRDKKEHQAYRELGLGEIIRKDSNPYKIAFNIELECFNAGRGVAFNISHPKATGMTIYYFPNSRTPLYLTKEDGSFEIRLMLVGKFDELYKKADLEIPVSVSLTYTNDQNNIFCRSIWQMTIKPFVREGENLKTNDYYSLQRSGKIEYSQTPYEN